MPFAPFTKIYSFFDDAVQTLLVNGTANMIALISPMLAVCFSIYIMLILFSYWTGDNDEPVMDFLSRMIGWGVVITFGLNIDMYKLYVAPFITGLGDDLAGTVGNHSGSAAALDTMGSSFIDAFIKLYVQADGIKATMFAVLAIGSVSLFGGAFMVVAIVYIILAKIALGILVATGPLFIASALFPATRDLFKNWTGQCLNYAFLVMLFSFAAQIEITMVNGMIPNDMSLESLFQINLICAVIVFVSLNFPSLASALAGGVGISSMVGKFRFLPGMPGIGGSKPGSGGGEIKPGKPSEPKPRRGGSVEPEQKS